jgi:tetratricopeptide (TPR) repeat protein
LVLRNQGKYNKAEQMNRRILEGRKKALGKEHPDTLISVNNLASVLQDQGKYDDAEAMYRQILEGRKKALGNEHEDTLTTVNNLALVLQNQKKYKQAKTMHRCALEGREKTLGKEHPILFLRLLISLNGAARPRLQHNQDASLQVFPLDERLLCRPSIPVYPCCVWNTAN